MRTLVAMWLIVAVPVSAGVGDPLKKWTWMMDQVEVEGIVRLPADGVDLILAINDDVTADNDGTVKAYVAVGSEPIRGPFVIGKDKVHTGIRVPPGAQVNIGASGTIDVGGRTVDASGIDEMAPPGFPAEGLRKYSLVAKIGTNWYAAGSPFTANGADRDIVGNGDSFDLELDPNYRHLASQSGNNPLPWYSGEGAPRHTIHVETYANDNGITSLSPPPLKINHPNPAWPASLPVKGDEPFMVLDPDTGQKTALRVGDHVRLIGRWCLENQHEDARWTRFRGLFGTIRVGVSWSELHPFDYERIVLVRKPAPPAKQRYVLALAAPIYEEKYMRGGVARGVVDRVFIARDGSNFHNRVTVSATVNAPPLPPPFRPHADLISYSERPTLTGIGMDVRNHRNVRKTDRGIVVNATVAAPVVKYVDGIGIADLNDPANGRSVLRIEYEVGWLPRLVAVTSRGSRDALDAMRIAPTADDMPRAVPLFLWNRGPDELTIARVSDGLLKPARMPFRAAEGMNVPPFSVVEVHGTFLADTPGPVRGELEIVTNDPVAPAIRIPVIASGVAAARIDIAPRSGNRPLADFGDVRLGATAKRTVRIRNIGQVDVRLSALTPMSPTGDDFAPAFVVNDSAGPLLRRGATRDVDVTFTPTALGEAAAAIQVIAETPGSDPTLERKHRIELRGRGTGGVIELTPDFVTFPDQILRRTSAPIQVTLRNAGTAPIAVSGLQPADEAAAATDCTTVAVGATCSLFVSFQPKSSGARYSAVHVLSDAVGGTSVLELRGIGVAAPILHVGRTRIEFSGNITGRVSRDEPLTVRNDGTAPLTIAGATIGGPNASRFAVTANGCVAPLWPEHICRIMVAYLSPQAGTHAATLRITTAHGESADVALEGVAADP